MKKLLVLLPFLLLLALPVSAFDYETEDGTFKNLTVAEYKELFSDFTGGYEALDGVEIREGSGEFAEHLVPYSNNLYDLGSSAKKWKDVYIAGSLSTAGLLPFVANTYDIGSYALPYQDIYASGTIYGNTLDVGTIAMDAAVLESLTLGDGSSMSTWNGSTGTTSTIKSSIEIMGAERRLDIGNGSATSSITGTGVGIGTPNPLVKLHVQGGGATLPALSTNTFLLVGGITSAANNTELSIIGGVDALVTNGLSILNLGNYQDEDDGGIEYDNNLDEMRFYTSGHQEMMRLDGDSFALGIDRTSYLMTLYSAASTTPLLAIGNGAATTTIGGGAAGNVTSTFAGDVVIDDIYIGKLELPLDNGISGVINASVSSGAATGTPQGYDFEVDSIGVARIDGRSDAQGLVWDTRFGLYDNTGNASTTMWSPRNDATSTPLMDIKESALGGQGSCIPLTASTGGTLYVSVANIAGTESLVVSSSTCMASDITETR